MVLLKRFEIPRNPDFQNPKSGASANFATRAVLSIKGLGGFDELIFAFVLQIVWCLLAAEKKTKFNPRQVV